MEANSLDFMIVNAGIFFLVRQFDEIEMTRLGGPKWRLKPNC